MSVLAALRHRPALEEPDHGDERRVEDRDREHEQRQHPVATVVPAAFQLAASPMHAREADSWLPASPMNTAAPRPRRRL